MSIHKYPSDSTYSFGNTAEVGITVDTYEQNDSIEIFEQKDEVGETVEATTFNPHSEITISGEYTADLAQVLGLSMTIANLITVQVGSGGQCIVKSVNYNSNRSKNKGLRLTAAYFPLIAS